MKRLLPLFRLLLPYRGRIAVALAAIVLSAAMRDRARLRRRGVLLWVGAHDVFAGRLSAGSLTAFICYAVIVANATVVLAGVYGELQRAAGASERLLELLATEPRIRSPAVPVPLPHPPRGEVAFEDVTFHYLSRPHAHALGGFSLAIRSAGAVDRAILLLDEATSALDAESETAVQRALERLMRGRTTLVIAHRLATVKSSSRIVVMDHGRIVAAGTHASLVADNGLCARLAALQFAADAAGVG